MSNTKIATAARRAGLAGLLGAAAAATVIGFAGSAHAATGGTNGMYGNPAAAAPYWRHQTSSDCAEMAVADVVGQVTHHEPTERQIEAMAENTPSAVHSGSVWHPGAGTQNQDLPTLLARYGIQSHVNSNGIQGLEQALAAGHKVIAALNAETIWNQPGQRTAEDHFVVVTGIDTKAGVVHLNDSGIPNGRDEKVSIATFERAWAAKGSNHFAVVTTR